MTVALYVQDTATLEILKTQNPDVYKQADILITREVLPQVDFHGVIFSLGSMYKISSTVKTLLIPDKDLSDFHKIIFVLIEKGLENIWMVSGQEVAPFSNYFKRKNRRKWLYVFPGKILPIKNGASCRAFDLILRLCFRVDLTLMITPNSNLKGRYKTLLRSLGVSFVFCDLDHYRKRLGRAQKILVDFSRGKKDFFPSFARANSQRISSKSAELLNSLEFDCVIFSYVWTYDERIIANNVLVDSIDYLTGRAKTICEESKFSSFWISLEQRFESLTLSRDVKTIAISLKDRDSFKKEYDLSSVFCVSPTFAWVAAEPFARERSPKKPVLGFLGGHMAANVEALNKGIDLLNSFKYFEEGGSLVIAGEICKKIDNEQDGLVKLGWLSSVQEFYKFVDVVFAPITVEGGLNFKIFEALAAGKEVITNETGGMEFEFRPKPENLHIYNSDHDLEKVLLNVLRQA